MTIRISIAGKLRKSNQHGFTYIMVLVAVIIVGLLAGVGTQVVSRLLKADREAELLFRGQAYKNAIKHYYDTGRTFPRSLDELLLDPRFANKRYLRALYPDPMGKDKKEWVLIRAPDGGISGVASAGKEPPLKQVNFPKGLETFQAAKSYSDWIFEYVPKQGPLIRNPALPAPPAGPPVMRVN
ncbi:MAG TPA: type II secretion system protein [Acidiferrobacterales bacterium]|nr:type II secretion system protein [Acidiferrobacterales bacterium]